jgi:hypothetical protein
MANPGAVGDENVERLIGRYAPVTPDAAFVQRLEALALTAARDAGRTRAAAQTTARTEARDARLRAWLRPTATAAAAALLLALGFALGRGGRTDEPTFVLGGAPVDAPPVFGGLAVRTDLAAVIDSTQVIEPALDPSAINEPSTDEPSTDEPPIALDGDGVVAEAAAPAPPGLLRAASRAPAPALVTLTVGAALETGPLERQRVALPDGSTLCLDAGARVRVVAERRVALERGEVFVEVAPRPDDPFVLATAEREVVALGTAFAVRADGPDPRVVVTHGRVRVGDDVLESGWRLSLRDLARTPLGRTTHVLDWARDLIASQDGPLVPRHAHAGGALVVSDPHGGEAPLTLRRYAVDVHVEDGFARTAVDQTYFNHDLARHEGTFLFPLPPDASISRLAMYVEGTRMEGGMVERERARTVFEEILHQRRDPALLEWLDGSTFRMRVFPLEPRQEKRIVLGYTQRLASAYGAVTYRFPAGHSLGATGTWSFRVRVKGGARRAWECRTHALEAQQDGDDLLLVARAGEAALGRDVVLTIEPPATEAQVLSAAHDGARYLALRVRNDVELAPRPRRRDWVFVVETSADRDPLLARVAYDAVRGLLESAETGDTFALVAASTRADLLTDDREPCAPDNVRAALERLEAQPLRGALDLGAALALAGEVALDAEAPVIVHLGTAIPVLGERAEPALVATLPEGAQYVGIGVGKRWNRAFMRAAASRTGGYLTSIHPDEPVRWRALEVRSALDAPRLLDLTVEAPGSALRFLTDADALAHGEDLLAVARLEKHDQAPARLVITGTLDGAPWRREVQVGAPASDALYLPRTWGRLELDRLLAAPEVDQKRIVALSKQLHVMSPYTSLLVLETEAMHRQYDVPMGRVEPWAPYELPALIPVVRESGLRGGEPRSVREVLESILVRCPADPLALQPGWGGSTAWGEQARREWAHLPRAVREDRITRFLDRREPQAERRSDDDMPRWDEDADERALAREEESALRRGSFDDEDALSDWDLDSAEETALRQAPQPPPPPPQAPVFGSSFLGGITQRTIDGGASRNREANRPPHELLSAAVEAKATRPWRDRSARVDVRELRGRRVQDFQGVPPDHRLISADLLAFAPGMNTTQTDVLTVLDAESSLGLHAAPGRIEPAAQALIEAARRAPWTTATVVNEAGEVTGQVSFEGGGRFVLERLVTAGVRERVACDGTTLWHLYPELGVGARRAWSRFHHEDTLRSVVPWLLPATSDLARGADVLLASEGVVEVVPLGRDREVQQLVFDGERLTERRWIDARGQVTARERYGSDGVVEVEERGQGRRQLRFQLASRGAPERRELGPSSDFVVLPLPYRQVTPAEAASTAHELELAVGIGLCQPHSSSWAIQKLDERVTGGDRRPGLLTLSASLRLDDYHARRRGDPDPARTEELPLGRYVANHLRWLSRSGGQLPPLDSAAPAGSLFARLSLFAHLHARWLGSRPWLETAADVNQITRDGSLDLLRTLARDPHGAELAMALGSMITWTDDDEPAGLAQVASVFEAIAERPWLAEPAGLEAARLRLAVGEIDLARTRLLALHGRALAEGRLLPVDAALQRALGPGFADWAREAAETLVVRQAPLEALKLAGACDALGDVALCRELAVFAVGDPAGADPRTVELASRVLCEAGAAGRAVELLTAALAGPRADAELAWYATHVADTAKRRPLALAWLELAIELDDASPLHVLRPRFEGLFARYEQTLDALRTLDQPAPPELVLRIVRAIDRWRAIDPELTQPCQRASRLLAQLGQDPLAWDYLVTPLALKPADAATWASTAIALRQSGSLELADQAWAQAFACEQTNASYLWSRAELLLSRGEAERARPVLELLAAGSWHARFALLQRQARAALSTVARGEVRRAAARRGLDATDTMDAMDELEAEAVRPSPAPAAAAERSAR